MSAILFNAVAATDLFTSVDAAGNPVNHNLLTGDGAATTLVAGGAAGGLDETLDYWIIRISATTFKLADTQAHALAGTNIVDFTADTYGVLGIGLPFRRPRTYAALSQLKSADLNAMFDCHIAKAHGLIKVPIPPVIINTGTAWSYDPGMPNDQVVSTGAGLVRLAVPCEVGDTILGVELRAFGDGAVDAQIDLSYLDAAMVEQPIASLADNNRAAAWGSAIVSALTTPGTIHTMANNERLRLSVNANAVGYLVSQIKLIKYRLPS
jgi:hypothetical protein